MYVLNHRVGRMLLFCCLHYCSAVLQVTVQDILGVPIANLASLITTTHLSNTRNTCPKDLGASLHQKIMRAAPLPRKGHVTSNMRCFRQVPVTLNICWVTSDIYICWVPSDISCIRFSKLEQLAPEEPMAILFEWYWVNQVTVSVNCHSLICLPPRLLILVNGCYNPFSYNGWGIRVEGAWIPPMCSKHSRGSTYIYIYICIYTYMHIYIYICIYTTAFGDPPPCPP